MSQWIRLVAAIGLSACSTGLSAKPPKDMSWGKPGVSLKQFVNDTQECADTSKTTDVRIEPETLKLLESLSSLQMISMLQQMEVSPDTSRLAIVQEITKTKSEKDIARRSANFGAKYTAVSSHDVRDQLQRSLDQCLIDRGYVRIRLTKGQIDRLNKLKRNSIERTAYLYSIDSDQKLVNSQKVSVMD